MKKIILLTFILLPFCAFANQKEQSETEQQALKDALNPIIAQQDSLVQEFRQAPAELANTQEYQLAMQYQYDDFTRQQTEVCIDFIQNHKNSSASLMAMMMMSQEPENLPLLDSLFQQLTPAVQNTPQGQELNQFLHEYRATAIGSTAQDFTMNDTNGKPVKLSDFRGKYVLVDFWASWCMPCRKENPNVVRIHDQYKDRNFTILGVSLDDNREAWLRAIEKDRLKWTHVSDLKKWEQAPVAKLYAISAIPCSLLLDPQGRIVAKNLRGEELAVELAKLFD
jgi:peroxiredoxin